MRTFKDVFGNNVRLTDERLRHVRVTHPELARQLSKVKNTLSRPDRVVASKADAGVKLFYRYWEKTPVGAKHLCVVVKSIEEDYFVLTAYFTDTVKRGELVWPMGRK